MSKPTLTARQRDVLFVVSQNEPASARYVAESVLSYADAARSRLDRLWRRGLLDHQYGGLPSGVRVGFVLTAAGHQALEALDLPEDYEPGDDVD
ncbi:hypothetical protein V6N00_12550 [Tersicoccus sp. MR15.9]|uniref:hypothetical protein n=1 Tax=Tersicoccus mangrovi TaxID=3121635 RepID=UPI002FE65367